MLSLKANTSPQTLQIKQVVGSCVHRISSLGNLLISKPRGKPPIPPLFLFFCFCEKPFAQRSPTAALVLPAWFVARGDGDTLPGPEGMAEQETGTDCGQP